MDLKKYIKGKQKPQYKLTRDGKVIGTITGAVNEATIKEYIDGENMLKPDQKMDYEVTTKNKVAIDKTNSFSINNEIHASFVSSEDMRGFVLPLVADSAKIEGNSASIDFVANVDGKEIAISLNNSKVLNSVVLGFAAPFIGFDKETWLSTVESTVPPKTVEINKTAFLKGMEQAKN